MVDEYITNQLFHLESLPEEQKQEFYLDEEEQGGLELMLPGAYYDVMRKQHECVATGDKSDHFGKLKKNFMKKREKKLDVAPIGTALNYVVKLNDGEVGELLELRFSDNFKQTYIPGE